MFGGATGSSFVPGQLDSEIQSIAATTVMMFGELNQCAHCVYGEGEICT